MEILNALLESLMSHDDLLAPIEMTSSSTKAKLELIALVDGLPSGDIHQFVLDTINSGNALQTFATISDGVIVADNYGTLGSFVASDHYSDVTSGVYQLSYNSDTYIGSSTIVHSRTMNHIKSFQGIKKQLYCHKQFLDATNGNWEDVNQSVIYRTLNFSDLYYQQITSPMTEPQKTMLRGLTQFGPRLLEYSLLDSFHSSFNKLGDKGNFGLWNPGIGYSSSGASSIPLSVLDTSGNLLQQFASIAYAAYILDIPRFTMNNWIQSGTAVFFTSLGAKVVFACLQNNIHRDVVKLLPYDPLVLPGGPLSSLNPGLFWIFLANKVDYLGPFNSLTSCARALFPLAAKVKEDSGVRKHLRPLILSLNLDKGVMTSKGLVYIACHPTKAPQTGNIPSSAKVPFSS